MRIIIYLLAVVTSLTSLNFHALAQDLVVKGAEIHTMAGEAIQDGVIVIEDGKIVAVGPASTITIPNNTRVLEANVVTPGLIDARTVVGLAGFLNQPHDQDQIDRTDPIQPELRAIDAYNPNERLVEWLRSFGITTIHTGHGPGALVSGQTMIVKTVGNTADQAVLIPSAMLAAESWIMGYGSWRQITRYTLETDFDAQGDLI